MIVYIKLPMYASYVILKGTIVAEKEDSYIIRIGDNKITVLKGFVFADKECKIYFSYQLNLSFQLRALDIRLCPLH